MAQEQQRDRWTNRFAFIMAAVGSAVGLGNLWRFPYIAYSNGGGAFFIPYLVALFTAGIPLMIVEYAIGQRYQGGAPQALAAVTRKFRWVGWFALLVATTITMYYVVVMAYAWHYAASSLTVAWNKPVVKQEVETDSTTGKPILTEGSNKIRLYVPARDADHKASPGMMHLAQRLLDREEPIPVLTPEELEAAKADPKNQDVEFRSLQDNTSAFFFSSVLGMETDYWAKGYEYNNPTAHRTKTLTRGLKAAQTSGDEGAVAQLREELDALDDDEPEGVAQPVPYVRHMFQLRRNLVIGAVLTWLMIFLIIFKGVHNVGKVVMLTVPLPVVLLLILIVRGLTLEGSTEGLIYYLSPRWEMLKDPGVWISAYGQVFFSLSLGFGILIAYASYMPRESDVTNSAFITSLGNCATSFLAGLAVFSVLGYLAFVSGKPVDGVVSGGPGLVFVTYPVALSEMPVGMAGVAIISLLFFICLITLGIDSAFSLVEGIVTGFRDRFPRINRLTMTAVACIVGLAGSLFFCTNSGLIWLDIVDNWMNNYGLPLVGLLECIAVGYFFHLDDLKDYINEHSEIKVHNWFDAFIKFVTPAILLYLLGQQFLGDVTSTYGGYDMILENSVTIAGWGWFVFLICVALFLARDHRALVGVLSAALLSMLFMFYFAATSAKPLDELAAAAVLGAVAATILFGGLYACICIARRTHHMAGLSLDEAGEEPEPMQDLDKDKESTV